MFPAVSKGQTVCVPGGEGVGELPGLMESQQGANQLPPLLGPFRGMLGPTSSFAEMSPGRCGGRGHLLFCVLFVHRSILRNEQEGP